MAYGVFRRYPRQVFNRSRLIPFGVTQNDQTIVVPTGSLTLTGFAPTVITPNTIDVPAGTLALTGLAPTVDTSTLVEVPVGTLSLIGFAPTVINPLLVDVPAGALSLTGFAPNVTTGNSLFVGVPTGALSLSGLAPSVVASSNQLINAPAGALSLSGFAPVINAGAVAETVTCTLVNTGGTSLPGLALLSWSWFDAVDPSLFSAPTDQGESETTDVSGQIVIDLTGTALTSGQAGTLVLRSNDGTLLGAYNLNLD